MKRLLLAFLLLTCSAAWATDITYTDKTTGGSFTAADANEIKTAVKRKLDKNPSYLTAGPATQAQGVAVVEYGNHLPSGSA